MLMLGKDLPISGSIRIVKIAKAHIKPKGLTPSVLCLPCHLEVPLTPNIIGNNNNNLLFI